VIIIVVPNMSAEDETLPPGWTKNYSKSQKKYYWCHLETKTSQWHSPTEEEIKNPLKAKKIAERKAKEEQLETAKLKQSSGSSHKHKSSSIKDDSSSKKAKLASGSITKSQERRSNKVTKPDDLLVDDSKTSVAIIVPFRDLHSSQNRSQHLARFLPHMTNFMSKQMAAGTVKDFHIYIIEQSSDGRKFNRGKLLNIGFELAKRTGAHHDVFIFHDVDLLPSDDLGSWYSRFPTTPIHIARCWDRYANNPKYFGGIVSFSASDMRRINGYPNSFWGWGGEDDEMQKRCEKLGMKWEYPPKGTIIDLEAMSLTEKLDFLRKNKEWKCMVKWEALQEHDTTWKTNGLADLCYSVIKREILDGTNEKATKITVDVQLNGTHWSNERCGADYMAT